MFRTGLRMFAGQMRLVPFVLCLCLTTNLLQAQTALTNGGVQQGTLPAGGVVSYTFPGTAGQSVQVRVGATSFVPKIDLYAANGLLLGSAPATAPSTAVHD